MCRPPRRACKERSQSLQDFKDLSGLSLRFLSFGRQRLRNPLIFIRFSHFLFPPPPLRGGYHSTCVISILSILVWLLCLVDRSLKNLSVRARVHETRTEWRFSILFYKVRVLDLTPRLRDMGKHSALTLRSTPLKQKKKWNYSSDIGGSLRL